MMRRFIQYLAKKFNVSLEKTRTVIEYRDREVVKYIAPNEVIEGNVYVIGDLVINGSLVVRQGDVIVYNKN